MSHRFPVSPAKEALLLTRMRNLQIEEKDIEEQFVHSAGKGGQNVNKTSTCVVLQHAPSGIALRCQKTRSQGLNRYYARQELCDRLEGGLDKKSQQQAEAISKIRRQKAKRSRRAKQKMLDDKKHRSTLKKLRKEP